MLAALLAWPATAVAQTPDQEIPDVETPDAQTPDAQTPDAQTPDVETPDAETPDAETPDTEIPDVEAPDTEIPDTETPDRVSCDEASGVFYLLCGTYELITGRFVDPVPDEDLAEAAARGVREAELAPRTADAAAAPACALPAPVFEQACTEIDAVADTEAAVWAATAEMVASLDDPNTEFLTAEQYNTFVSRLQNGASFSGIGLRLGLLNGTAPCRALSATCRLAVAEVLPGSPAELAGVKADDVVLELDGLVPSGTGCGLAGLRLFDLGTPVTVRLERDGRARVFVIEAAQVVDPGVASRIVDGNLGYLRLASFSANADRALSEELRGLRDAGVKALVLDLRGNLGGFLRTAVNITSLFLEPDELVTQVVTRDLTQQHLAARIRGAPRLAGLPMVVAVDGSSASASELLSLSLSDHGVATIVGMTTFGKFTGQVTSTVTDDDEAVLGAVRLTTLRWLSPDGRSAAGGIEPDVMVGFPPCAHPLGLTRQLAAAVRLPGAVLADIGQSGERFDAVKELGRDGVFDGTECEPGLFCPDEPVKRWELAVWLVRILDGADPEAVDVTSFDDVEPDQWWAGHVERLSELGVTLGCERDTPRFCPDEVVTRAQAATFFRRAFDLPSAVSAGFVDVRSSSGTVSRTVAANIDAVFAAGITSGCEVDPMRFCPHRAASRAELAIFLHRALER